MWNHDCTEFHDHRSKAPSPREFTPLSPESSVPSSPSTLSDSTASRAPSPETPLQLSPTKRERQKQRNAAYYQHLVAEDARIAADEVRAAEALKRQEELALLAAFRPPPIPISPRRLEQQFIRVLGPASVFRAPPESISRIIPREDVSNGSSANDTQPLYQQHSRHQPCKRPLTLHNMGKAGSDSGADDDMPALASDDEPPPLISMGENDLTNTEGAENGWAQFVHTRDEVSAKVSRDLGAVKAKLISAIREDRRAGRSGAMMRYVLFSPDLFIHRHFLKSSSGCCLQADAGPQSRLLP
jgi:hypothetical protein